MFQPYKIIFKSDTDEKEYLQYCFTYNMPKAIEEIIEKYTGGIVMIIPLCHSIKIWKKCKNLLTIER